MLNCRVLTEKKIKHVLVENELKKVKTFDFNYFIGKRHFEEDGVQNSVIRYFKIITNTKYIWSWQSKGL